MAINTILYASFENNLNCFSAYYDICSLLLAKYKTIFEMFIYLVHKHNITQITMKNGKVILLNIH